MTDGFDENFKKNSKETKEIEEEISTNKSEKGRRVLDPNIWIFLRVPMSLSKHQNTVKRMQVGYFYFL